MRKESGTNRLVMEVIGALLESPELRAPLAYGDPLLDRLLQLTKYARVPEFNFHGADHQPNKRNLWEWLKCRFERRSMGLEELYGFTMFSVRLAWRPAVAPLVCRLLDLEEVADSLVRYTGNRSLAKELKTATKAGDPYEANRRGTKTFRVTQYGVPRWNHRIDVDKDGAAHHTVDAEIVNIYRDPLPAIWPPIFTDAQVAESDLEPWVDSTDHTVQISVQNWSGMSGSFCISFQPALPAFTSAGFRWGYRTPRLFQPTDEYYRFDINNPTFHRIAHLQFSPEWKIENARVLDGRLLLSENQLTWELFFPPFGIYEIRFDLSRPAHR